MLDITAETKKVREDMEKQGYVLTEEEYQIILEYTIRKSDRCGKGRDYVPLLLEDEIKNYYFRNTVSVHYMADPDGIRSRSTAALEVLKENQDFQYLRSKLSGDLDKETSQCMNPVRYVLGMEDAIRRDDLVVMRRCQDPEYYVKYLRESRKKLDKILGSPILEPKLREGQLTIWDFIGGQ